MLKSYRWKRAGGLEHVELPHVLDLAVYLGYVVGGPCDFSVSPWSKSFFIPFLGDFHSTWGSVGTGAWTRTWTRA